MTQEVEEDGAEVLEEEECLEEKEAQTEEKAVVHLDHRVAEAAVAVVAAGENGDQL